MLKYPSATFLALTLAITYGIGLPIAAASHGLLRVDIPATLSGLALYVAIWGPALAAVVLSGLHSGRTGLRQLLGQLVNWRVGILWYLVALLTPAAPSLLQLWDYTPSLVERFHAYPVPSRRNSAKLACRP